MASTTIAAVAELDLNDTVLQGGRRSASELEYHLPLARWADAKIAESLRRSRATPQGFDNPRRPLLPGHLPGRNPLVTPGGLPQSAARRGGVAKRFQKNLPVPAPECEHLVLSDGERRSLLDAADDKVREGPAGQVRRVLEKSFLPIRDASLEACGFGVGGRDLVHSGRYCLPQQLYGYRPHTNGRSASLFCPFASLFCPFPKRPLDARGSLGHRTSFNICSSSNWRDYLEFCFRKTGRVTEGLWRMEVGDVVGFRGPYGNGYPVEQWRGRDLIFLGGGIAMPPIRCAISYALENRADYGAIAIVYGARTVRDLVSVDELNQWAQQPDVRVVVCVDPGGETPAWKGEIGFVPTVFERAIPARNATALVIGPPIMIKNTIPVIERMGARMSQVYTSLENRMKCGVGKCGRCNAGPVYVCKEGPVFSFEDLKAMPLDY